MTNNQTTPSILPIKRKRISLTAKISPNLQPRRKRSLLTFHNKHSSSSTLGGLASLPTNPNLPLAPLPLSEESPVISPTSVAAVKAAEMPVNSVPPVPHMRRSILTLQPNLPCTTRSENTTFRRKRKLSGALVNVDYISDEEPIVKLFKQDETPAPMFVGVPSESYRLKRNKIDDPYKCIVPTKEKNKDSQGPKKKNEKEVTLDLSQHTILSDANDVSHLQISTPGENDIFYDALSDENDDLEEPKKKDITLDLSQHTILSKDSNVVHLQMNASDEDDIFFDALSDENNDLEEPKKKNGKEVVLDLSQSSFLPNASNVAHLPKKKQMNTSDEDGVLFDTLSDENKDLEEQKKKKAKETDLDLEESKQRKGKNVALNLVRPKKKKQKEVVLDLSRHTILPNASYVAHLPKRRQMNTSSEDDVLFKCLLNENKNLEEPKKKKAKEIVLNFEESKQKKGGNVALNLVRPKKKKQKEVVLDLSQYTILPNASYVAHLPKRLQMNVKETALDLEEPKKNEI